MKKPPLVILFDMTILFVMFYLIWYVMLSGNFEIDFQLFEDGSFIFFLKGCVPFAGCFF